MSSHVTYQDKFVQNVEGFMDFGEDIIKQCYEKKQTSLSPNGIQYAIGFINGKIKDKGNDWLVQEFIKKTHEHWKEIHAKNTDHFMDKIKDLLPSIIEDAHIEELKRLFVTKGLLEEEDVEAFWEYVIAFCKLSIHYIHVGRKPVKEGEHFKYTDKFFPDIKLKDAAILFSVKLVA